MPTLYPASLTMPNIASACSAKAAPAIRFGNDTPTPPPSDSSPPGKSKWQSFLDGLWQAVTGQGVVRGTRQFFGVIADVLDWNNVLGKADPSSSYLHRFLAVTDLAYARYREGVLSRKENDTLIPPGPDAVTCKLYQGVLERFPKLVLEKPDALPLDVVAQMKAASIEGDALEGRIQALRSRYEGQTDIDGAALKDEVKQALNPGA